MMMRYKGVFFSYVRGSCSRAREAAGRDGDVREADLLASMEPTVL